MASYKTKAHRSTTLREHLGPRTSDLGGQHGKMAIFSLRHYSVVGGGVGTGVGIKITVTKQEGNTKNKKNKEGSISPEFPQAY